MAMAADTVIVEAEHIVPVGLISPDHVVTPAPLVDYLVAHELTPWTHKPIIAKRIAQELRAGMLVNLGIGIPTLVANYVPAGISVFFQSENGLIGTGPMPEEGMHHRAADRRRRQAGDRAAGRLHVRQRDVVRPDPRRPSST